MPFSDLKEIAALVGGGTTITPTAALPTDEDITALEERIRVKLPRDYKNFLKLAGSLLSTVDEKLWPRPEVGDVGPHWMQTRYQLSVFGVCEEVDWLRIEDEAARFREENETTLCPVFAWENTSDRICFGSDGALVAFTRDGGAKRLGETFEDALRRLLAEQREYKEQLRKG